jgi:hypothetical protein
MFCTALVWPSTVLKVSVVGLIAITGVLPTPIPVSATTTLPPGLLETIVRVPLRAPSAPGVKA